MSVDSPSPQARFAHRTQHVFTKCDCKMTDAAANLKTYFPASSFHFRVVGHAVGDQVLQQIAETLSCAARTTDFVARYGGEEFLLLLPDTDAEGALKLAERIRLAISASSKTAAGIITVSIGAACACEEDDTHETIVQRADEALYRAKANGRNRVEGG